MAEVYRAKAPGAEGIGKILAIKRILPQFTANSEFIEMFKGEASIAINLTHANIAPIYEFGVENKNFFLVMEFIDEDAGASVGVLRNFAHERLVVEPMNLLEFVLGLGTLEDVASDLQHSSTTSDGASPWLDDGR